MYIPLNCKTHFSILEAYQKPKEIASRIKELGIDRVGVAEYGNLCSSIQVLSKIPNSIIGMDIDNVLVFAKNLDGWYELIKLNNGLLKLDDTKNLCVIYKSPVGNPLPNSWWGVDLNNGGETLRKMPGRHVAIPTFISANLQGSKDFEIIMCIRDNDDMSNIKEKYKDYFNSKWHIRSYEELIEDGYTKQELDNTLEIGKECSSISISGDLHIPKYEELGNKTSYEFLRDLCLNTLKERRLENEIYQNRLESELSVISKYKLEHYFLVVRDIVRYVNDTYGLVGVRGSAGGCLVSYLIGITTTNPIQYKLFFERFLNEGRFTAERIQPPDIDIDMPSDAREETIKWIRTKYGYDKTGQIMTYPTIKSPAAIKAVFRSRNTLPFAQVNEITKLLPPDHKISDKMKESGDTSVIMWCLKNKPELLTQWVRLNEKEEIDGDYKEEFEQAIRLEGTYSARSKHAGGLIVSDIKLTENCPLVKDDDIGEYCGWDMYDLESAGFLKIDLLGIRVLDKILEIKELVECNSKN